MDEGWTRWVLEQYEFAPRHHQQRRRCGAATCASGSTCSSSPTRLPREIIDGYIGGNDPPRVPRRHRRGRRGGDLRASSPTAARSIALGAASDLAIDRLPLPVRNLKRGLRREQHYAPGTILRLQVDTVAPARLRASPPETLRLLHQQPVLRADRGLHVVQDRRSSRASRPVNVVASGWLQGEELMAGRAAVVSIDMNPGPGRAVRHPSAAPRPDARHVPDAVQRALPGGRRRERRRGRPTSKVIRIFVTGGTFDKEYNELDRHADLQGHAPARDAAARPVARRRVDQHADDDRQPRDDRRPIAPQIVARCREAAEARILITHGTDTMIETARALAGALPVIGGKTIVLTGAMVPYAFGSSDGLFNLGSALSFVQVLPPGRLRGDERPRVRVGSRQKEPGNGDLRRDRNSGIRN